jgi:hypothetical protein
MLSTFIHAILIAESLIIPTSFIFICTLHALHLPSCLLYLYVPYAFPPQFEPAIFDENSNQSNRILSIMRTNGYIPHFHGNLWVRSGEYSVLWAP